MATLFGTGKDEAPTNGDLGSLAYMNANEVEIDNGRAALDEYQKAYTAPKIKPTLNLPFAKMSNFDPRVSFSRASDAYAYEGESTKAEENLVLYSEQFDNASWVKVNITTLANQTIAPNSTNTADLLAENTNNGIHGTNTAGSSAVIGQTFTQSVFAKKGTGSTSPDWIQLTFNSGGFGVNQYANFDIANGVVGTVVGGTASITPSANGFFRLSFTATATTATTVLLILTFTNNQDIAERTPSYAGQTTSDVFVWGAQLEQRDTLTDYQRTTDRIIQRYIDTYSLVTSNKPRFKEIDPITKERKGLLVEEARTNLFFPSNDFTNATWGKGLATIEAGVPSPIGVGFLFRENDLFGIHQIGQPSSQTIPTGVSTISLYYKKSTGARRFLKIVTAVNTAAGGGSVTVDTDSNTILSSTVPTYTPRVEQADNGWYRVSITYNLASSSNVFFRLYDPIVNTENYQGDGYSGIYISQAQLEVGSFATSPILTGASAVTRSFDNAFIETSLSGVEFFTSGTLYAAGTKSLPEKGNIAETSALAGFGTSSNSVFGGVLGFDNRNNVVGFPDSFSPTKYLDTSGLYVRLAISYEDYYIKVKGYDGDTSLFDQYIYNAQLNEPPIKLGIGNVGRDLTFQSPWLGHVDHVAYYPQALSADELAFLTRNTNE